MDQVTLVTEGWAARVHLARSFLDRWRGMRRISGATPILLPTRSVHGFGLEAPLQVAVIDAGMRVEQIRTLRPGGVLTFPTARYVLEIPMGSKPPPPDSILELVHG